MARRGLRGIWVRGTLPDGPVVWAANHHSWWDPFVAHAVLQRRGRPAALLMDPANLAEFGLVRRVGVVGSPREALAALRRGEVLVIYPEAELRPAAELGPIRPGAQWLAAHSEAHTVAVALRVAMRGHEAPEAYVDLTPVGAGEDLSAVMGKRLAVLDDELRRSDPREPLAGFDAELVGRRSWDERLQRLGRRRS